MLDLIKWSEFVVITDYWGWNNLCHLLSLLFKINLLEIHTLLHAFKPILEAIISKTFIINAATAFSGVQKYWTINSFFTLGNKKNDSSNRFLSAQKCTKAFEQCVISRIVVMKRNPSSTVGFSDFLADN